MYVLKTQLKILFNSNQSSDNVATKNITDRNLFRSRSILNAKIILRGKDYGCGKFLWKYTQNESFISWLRNWSCFITSSSSSTLLLDIEFKNIFFEIHKSALDSVDVTIFKVQILIISILKVEKLGWIEYIAKDVFTALTYLGFILNKK